MTEDLEIMSPDAARERGLLHCRRRQEYGFAVIPVPALDYLVTVTRPERLERVERYLDGLNGTPMSAVFLELGDCGRYWIFDGNHRIFLARKRGWTHIPALLTSWRVGRG